MIKSIKYRIYPNKDQVVMLEKTFGCCRKLWNLMLEDKIAYFQDRGEVLYTTPAKYKNLYPYLKEVDCMALCNVQKNLEMAYKNCFGNNRHKRCNFPKYKSGKRSRKSYTTNRISGRRNVDICDGSIKLPKLGKVKAKLHRLPESGWKLKSATVVKDRDGTYYVSVNFEIENFGVRFASTINNVVGLDYKSDGLFVDSNGEVCGSPKYYRNSSKTLSKLHKRLSRKVIGSKNREKARVRYAKIHKHIANQRKDFLHKKSTEIANQYDVVCVEGLDLNTIANKGFGNGKSVMDNGYGMFLDMLQYKLDERGKHLIRVDRWFPSSQICNRCGGINKIHLSQKVYKCGCGYVADRDYNAAQNIRDEGLRILYAV